MGLFIREGFYYFLKKSLGMKIRVSYPAVKSPRPTDPQSVREKGPCRLDESNPCPQEPSLKPPQARLRESHPSSACPPSAVGGSYVELKMSSLFLDGSLVLRAWVLESTLWVQILVQPLA